MSDIKADVGVIGMAVMGKNLALNIEHHGYTVGVWNRTGSKTKSFVKNHADKNLVPSYDLRDFINSLKKPRRIIMMIKSGQPIDKVINQLTPMLDRGDVLIDGGNTNFHATMRRNAKLAQSGINFIGMGVSGGELGALHGPSLMPGGQKRAYQIMAPIFDKIAAKTKDGQPCVTYVGPNGAGHYVKMIHNGIEYGDEELIDETYNLLRNLVGIKIDKLAKIFAKWNRGELNSYLVHITADILSRKDDLGSDESKPIIDMILDKVQHQGPGKWSSEDAMELGAPQSLITEAVYARFISTLKDERMRAAQELTGPRRPSIKVNPHLIEQVRQALYFGKIISYTQGFAQLKMASAKYQWHLRYGQLAQIWRAGCIIRAKFLQNITDAFHKNPKLDNLLLDPYFADVTKKYQNSARNVVSLAIKGGIPVPCLSTAISYYDAYRTKVLPTNLLQAQRDYFGAHTYQRIDRPGIFHYTWYREQ